MTENQLKVLQSAPIVGWCNYHDGKWKYTIDEIDYTAVVESLIRGGFLKFKFLSGFKAQADITEKGKDYVQSCSDV